MASDSNRDVVYLECGGVEVQKIDFPTFRNPAEKTIDHGVILRNDKYLRLRSAHGPRPHNGAGRHRGGGGRLRSAIAADRRSWPMEPALR